MSQVRRAFHTQVYQRDTVQTIACRRVPGRADKTLFSISFGAQFRYTLNPLNTIVLCDVRGVSGGVLNWAHMIAERRQSLGQL